MCVIDLEHITSTVPRLLRNGYFSQAKENRCLQGENFHQMQGFNANLYILEILTETSTLFVV